MQWHKTNSPSISEAVHAAGKRGTKGVESEEISSNKVGKLKRAEGKEQLIIMIPNENSVGVKTAQMLHLLSTYWESDIGENIYQQWHQQMRAHTWEPEAPVLSATNLDPAPAT